MPDHGAEGEPGALVHQRRDRHLPAVADPADHVLVGDPGLLDEQLVELALAGDLDQWAHLHPLLLHVHQEVGEALVLGRVGVGAGDQHAPLGELRQCRPDLLPGDHPLVSVLDRLRLQRGQIGSRLGLGEPLAPDLLGAEDRLQVALLLLLGAVGDHHRPAHRQAEDVGRQPAPRRGPSPGRRSPARSSSPRARRTPSARRPPPSRPRACAAATRPGRGSPDRAPRARGRGRWPRARREARRATAPRTARGSDPSAPNLIDRPGRSANSRTGPRSADQDQVNG